MFDPAFGELLNAREVSDATGLTMNQLRNWRNPDRMKSAPFGFVQIGSAPYYRKATIDLWTERHGGSNRKFYAIGLDAEIPVNDVLEADTEKRKRLAILASITTANQFFRWGSTLGDILQERYGNGIREHSRRLYGMWKGISPEEAQALEHVTRGQMAKNLEQYYVGSTLAHRRLWADTQGWDITDAEIVSLPVGDIPPLKETK
jgi:hypothetical protein